ncbi:ATP-binding protein [Persicobacter sp. CCB-QB2]|uniref:sensor histidine kinase n=1 Tax=Persicobacter sp. CCB-QB2 TaxID=1561025 RepID=UPI0006A9F82A|nr:ATP-binding protein [Persicobacter sp. CCB-QB2]
MDDQVRILFIDDDEEDYIITKDLISEIPNRNYSIEWISNYQDGLQAIRHHDHDVYLVDYRLGAYTGIELIREAVQLGITAPLILLTGQLDQQVDDQAVEVGAADYVYKGGLNSYILDRSIRYSLRHAQNLVHIQHLNEELEQRVEDRTRELAVAVKKLKRSNDSLEKQIEVRRSTEKALRQSQRLYKAIARNFPKGIISVVDRNFDFVFIDGQELDILGLASKRMIGMPATDFLATEEKGIWMENFNSVFQGNTVAFEVSIGTSAYKVNGVPLFNSLGYVKQILLVLQNITEAKKAEEEIRKSLAKEIELNELKTRFVTTASHEFRTPLSTILSSASLIGRYTESEQQDRRDKHVGRIKSSVNNLTGILNDFLSISKLEEGKIKNTPETIVVKEKAQQVVDEIQVLLRNGQQINFDFQGAEEDVIKIDPQIFKNILINLLSNAIKYSQEGKEIVLGIEMRAEQMKVRVKDNGMGISDSEQVHIFERFFRANNAQNIQGTGLGLNIVKKYVDMLGGEISFESALGEGTTFYINIPHQIEA